MKRLVLVVFLFEVGVVLIFIPWSAFWDRNYFAQLVPPLQTLITNNFVRGAVSGLGVLNVLAGFGELVALIWSRASDTTSAVRSSSAVQE